ncbi:MAG: SemiSWEET family transporter [bacterium]|nr:SemiSWEET family transporter [bacterium]
MEFQAFIGWLATVLTAAQFIPQAVRAVKSKTMEGVSRPTFMMVIATSVLWFIHGLGVGNRYIVITNIFTGITGIVVVWRSFVVERRNKLKTG